MASPLELKSLASTTLTSIPHYRFTLGIILHDGQLFLPRRSWNWYFCSPKWWFLKTASLHLKVDSQTLLLKTSYSVLVWIPFILIIDILRSEPKARTIAQSWNTKMYASPFVGHVHGYFTDSNFTYLLLEEVSQSLRDTIKVLSFNISH